MQEYELQSLWVQTLVLPGYTPQDCKSNHAFKNPVFLQLTHCSLCAKCNSDRVSKPTQKVK